MRKVRAFTLIELLIVMAILTLLAGIAYSVFGGAREKARQTQCMNNLKQLGAAILLYRADYDGEWPNSLISTWPQYVNSKEVLVCPDDGTPPAEREKLEQVFHLPYCTYACGCGADLLPVLSGATLPPAHGVPSLSCRELAASVLTHRLRDRACILIGCYCHLLPGSNCRDTAWYDQRITDEQVHSVIPTLWRDGSVSLVTVPGKWGAGLPSLHHVLGLSSDEWFSQLDQVEAELRQQGLCSDEEGSNQQRLERR